VNGRHPRSSGPHRVGVHLSPNGSYNDMGSPDYREQFTFVAGQLDRFGLAYLHVVDGLAFGFHNLGAPMTLTEFHQLFHGPLIGNCGYTQQSAEEAIAAGNADLISFGRPFISNPDLAERFRHGWPLSKPAPMSDLYSPTGGKGYTDFPPPPRAAIGPELRDQPHIRPSRCVPFPDKAPLPE
jgi:N-ethylmaleimide reductase